MKPTKMVRFRVTEEQYKLLCSKAIYYGHTTLSSYLRDVALKDLSYVRMLKDIHEKIC